MITWFEKEKGFRIKKGGVLSPKGFRSSAVSAGLKKKGPDVALLVSDTPVKAAGVFTDNIFPAAPVILSKKNISGQVRGILINSKYANSYTGKQGLRDAGTILKALAGEFGEREDRFLMASTGVIGERLPVNKLLKVLPKMVKGLSPKDTLAARAIMTTDTKKKTGSVEFFVHGKKIVLGGMAKGAGMIAPNMGTMLAFITTDCLISRELLNSALKDAVRCSFNRITVDGDKSTNDSVYVLANGRAGNPVIQKKGDAYDLFARALKCLCQLLALQIIEDGEGATKLVEISLTGAKSSRDAESAVRSVSQSLLVKTAFYGSDLNWGRIINAVGYSGARSREDLLTLKVNGLVILKKGLVRKKNMNKASCFLKKSRFSITIDLGMGPYQAHMLTTDLSEEYVRINSDYRS